MILLRGSHNGYVIMENSNFLFILGAQKTGTSTVLGILNCHPELFIAFEWFLDKHVSKFGWKYYRNYFVKEENRINKRKSITKNYKMIRHYLKKAGYNYKYFGDKHPRLGNKKLLDRRMKEYGPHYIVFTVRDIRTWLCHSKVNGLYKTRKNIVPATIRYLYYFVSSFKLEKCLVVRMEDLFAHDALIKRIDNFLPDIDCSCMSNWWDKIGKYDDFNKNLNDWWNDHQSALVKPFRQDVQVSLKQNDFFDAALNIFDKYYFNIDAKFEESEIDNDLANILDLDKISDYEPIENCYDNFFQSPVRLT